MATSKADTRSSARPRVTAGGGDTGPRSLMRILGMLDAIARAPEGLTLARLNAVIGAPKSSLLMLLRPMVAAGYLVHEQGRYHLGQSTFTLAATIHAARGLPRLLHPWLERISAATGESVYLAMLDEESSEVEYVDGVQSPQAVRYWVELGARRSLYAGSAGRIFLAFKPKAWRDRYLERVVLMPKTTNTITSKPELLKQADKVRRDGYALSRGEAIEGAAGLAAPVLDAKGALLAAILIGTPDDRMGREMERYRKVLIDACERIRLELSQAE